MEDDLSQYPPQCYPPVNSDDVQLWTHPIDQLPPVSSDDVQLWTHPIHEQRIFISNGRQIQGLFDTETGLPTNYHGLAQDTINTTDGQRILQYPFPIEAATISIAFANFDASWSLVREINRREHRRANPHMYQLSYGHMLG